MNVLSMMEIFHSVAMNYSFTKAANELGFSKSFVSVQINQLETHFKMKLLHRTTRHISLTAAGESFLESCKKVIAEKKQAVSALESLQNEPAGKLKISAPPSMCASYLAKLIPQFIRSFPKISVELESSVTIKDLNAHQTDVAIRMTRNPDENYVARLIGEFRLAVCATPQYLKINSVPNKPADLQKHNCLIYSSDPTGFYWEFQKNNIREDIEVRGNLISDNSFAIQQAMLCHEGIARLPSYLLHEDLKNKKIVLILDEYNEITLPIYALYSAQPSAKIKAFIGFVKEYFDINS